MRKAKGQRFRGDSMLQTPSVMRFVFNHMIAKRAKSPRFSKLDWFKQRKYEAVTLTRKLAKIALIARKARAVRIRDVRQRIFELAVLFGVGKYQPSRILTQLASTVQRLKQLDKEGVNATCEKVLQAYTSSV